MISNKLSTIIFILSFLLSVPQVGMAADKKDPGFRSIADLGFGFVDEDGFILLLLEQNFAWRGLDIAIAGPLRFRVVDRAPNDNKAIRNQDWDEPSDFARILRHLSYVHEWNDGGVDLFFGELNNVGIGHGSIVDAYFNSTDMDYYQGGLLLKGETGGNGLEFMFSNVVAPELITARVFLAPIAWFSENEWARRFEFGYSFGADMKAPRMANSNVVIPVTGPDLSFRLVDNDRFVLMPYTDLMFMDGDVGFHGGLATQWVISAENEISLGLRGEYRFSGGDYHPGLFSPFYEHNRRFYDENNGGDRRTFADHLADADNSDSGHGLMFDLVFEWAKGLRLGARYDREGSNRPHWLMFRAQLFPWDGYGLSVFYASQDIHGGSHLFSADSLIGFSGRYRIIGPLDVFTEFTRRWRRVGDEMGFANETGAGIGLSFNY